MVLNVKRFMKTDLKCVLGQKPFEPYGNHILSLPLHHHLSVLRNQLLYGATCNRANLRSSLT